MSEGKKTSRRSPAERVDHGVREITKYRNRRLYDSRTSRYITLAEVRALVMAGEPFRVRDAKTEDDVTRGVLLQILLEEEAGGVPIFSDQALADLIRFYGHASQWFVKPYFEKNIQAMAEIQAMLAQRSTKSNPELWRQFMQMQPPMVQALVNGYIAQSQATLLDLQERLNEGARQVWDAFRMRN
jgi:polyhydroxyalkanoate synthesis repressor PhaR